MADASRHLTIPSRDGHLLLLHQSEGDRLARLATWVRHGLGRGEKVVYTEGAVSAGSSIFARLRAQGIDVDAARAEGRFEVVPLTAFCPPGGQDSVVDRALDEGFAAVRISGEAAAALTVLTPQAHQVLEQKMDRLCRTRPVSALCQYARRATVGAGLRTAVATHPGGVWELAFGSSASEAGLALRGEADVANADLLAAVLGAAAEAAESAGRGELRVDLAAVEFLDVAACRAIADAGQAFRAAGRRLVLLNPAPMVERVLRLVGLGDEPGVQLIGSPG